MTDNELERIAREERNAYYRAYRQKNKERISEHQKRYWQRKAEQKYKAEQTSE